MRLKSCEEHSLLKRCNGGFMEKQLQVGVLCSTVLHGLRMNSRFVSISFRLYFISLIKFPIPLVLGALYYFS